MAPPSSDAGDTVVLRTLCVVRSAIAVTVGRSYSCSDHLNCHLGPLVQGTLFNVQKKIRKHRVIKISESIKRRNTTCDHCLENVCACKCTCACMHSRASMCVCAMCVVHVCACASTRECAYVHARVYMHACVRACLCVCTHE